MRVGILTSGGDCQALNATMRGLVKALYQQRKDIEIIGFLKGYQGLMYEKYKKMSLSDFEDILNVGGTKVEAMKKTYKKLKLDCLVVLGGNGSLKSANMLAQEGLNVIGLPKTIDNDTWGTDYTFGFQSAVDIATNYLNEIETTAKSHSRVFVVEIMGHKVGHICLQAGIAAGVDAILLPEIPYDIKVVAKKIKENQKTGKEYTIIACAEGAISEEDSLLSKKKYKAKVASRQGRSVAYEIAEQLQELIPNEVRVALAGHIQRGGNPCSYDRFMATRFGVYGANLLLNKDFGKLVVFDKNEIKAIPLSETAGKLKFVDPECEVVSSAKKMGITFGE